jgi:hypothetical protein
MGAGDRDRRTLRLDQRPGGFLPGVETALDMAGVFQSGILQAFD